MDPRSFDRFTRCLSTCLPRRRAISLLAGAVASRLVGASPVEAACKKVGKKCDKNKDCCDGAKCKGKKCKCKGGKQKCDKKCYDLDKAANHCGFCDNACPSGSCLDGSCACGFTGDDCPEGCLCAVSLPGLVCIGSLIYSDTPCQGNSDCPPGSACLVTIDGFRCGTPCWT